MPEQENFIPLIYLPDGQTNFELGGCVIVLPSDREASLFDMRERYDLNHLVRWALAHGYAPDSMALTITWDRSEIEEALSRPITNAEWLAAREWLDTTGGGRAANTAYHLWEDVLSELEHRLAGEQKVSADDPDLD